MGHHVKKVSLVHVKKKEDAKFGKTIVNQVLNLIYKRYPSTLYDFVIEFSLILKILYLRSLMKEISIIGILNN